MPIDPDEFEFTPEELDELLATTDERSPEEMARVEARLRIFAKQLQDAGFGGTELPDDLVELKDAVSKAWIMRELANVPMTHPFEGYQILDTKLGGMGMVLEGLDPRLDRKVAIKMWISDDEKAKAGALEEAKTLAKLDHVNIVKVYDTGVWNGRVYFVMEWVEGANGAEWIDDETKAHDWRTVRDVYVAAGRGLAHAHAKGIAHRDFKPSNILVGDDPGVVKVADFGIADRLRSSTPECRRTKVGGSRSYMAPERLDGVDGDARADQFSFCVALWEALFDQPPYLGVTPIGLLAAIEAHEILPCDPLADVPHWLSRVVRRGLHPDPEQRYPSMDALVEALTDDPPPGDPSEGGVDESELFETEGYINAPASEGDIAELAESVAVPTNGESDSEVDVAELGSDDELADAPNNSGESPVELQPRSERQYSKRELVRASVTTGVTVALTMAVVLILVRPSRHQAAMSSSLSWVSKVAMVANVTVNEAASRLKKKELEGASEVWRKRVDSLETTTEDKAADTSSMATYFLRECDELQTKDPRNALLAAQNAFDMGYWLKGHADANTERAAEAEEIVRQAAPLIVALEERVEVLDELQSKHSTVPSTFE